jgi:tryptophan 2,3-dioxygenase
VRLVQANIYCLLNELIVALDHRTYTLMMKTILFSVLFALSISAHGQINKDTVLLNELAKVYLTKMYLKKQYDSASTMLDKRVFLEMEDFYSKNNQGIL